MNHLTIGTPCTRSTRSPAVSTPPSMTCAEHAHTAKTLPDPLTQPFPRNTRGTGCRPLYRPRTGAAEQVAVRSCPSRGGGLLVRTTHMRHNAGTSQDRLLGTARSDRSEKCDGVDHAPTGGICRSSTCVPCPVVYTPG